MKNSLLLVALVSLITVSCESTTTELNDVVVIESPKDSIVKSFVFVGCNRMWWKDTLHTDGSMANIDALKNIFTRVAASKIKTDYFFFLGDIVSGESTNAVLDTQLRTWNIDYDRGKFSNFKASGITMIPVPGNHEMLNQDETPLAGTTDTWMKYMGKYMPSNRDSITGPRSAVDRLTYGFKDGNVAFIVMNTDTYNTDGPGGIGLESQIPYEWVKKQVAKYHADNTIDHIFVMGHRPFYVDCIRDTTHQGMCDTTRSNPVWRAFQDNNVTSMLSAHVHAYQRMQPDHKTYQIIAGNGGSPVHHHTPPPFFGYTRINIWSSGRIEMDSEGYDAPNPYYDVVGSPGWTIRDSKSDLNWYRSEAKEEEDCKCITGK